MEVTIESVNLQYALDGGEMQASLVLRLPSGDALTVVVDEEQTALIMKEAVGEDVDIPTETTEKFDSTEELVEELVDWMELPDDILLPHIKMGLQAAGFHPILSQDGLYAAVQQVVGNMMHAAKLDQLPSPAPVPATVPVPVQEQPPAPQPAVQYNTAPAQPSKPPIRTVQKDAWGYPMGVPQTVQDPGEVAAFTPDTDEDGVRSL